MNVAAFIHLSSRLNHLELAITSRSLQSGTAATNQTSQSIQATTLDSSKTRKSSAPIVFEGNNPQELINRMREFKARAANTQAAQQVSNLDALLAAEPKLPVIEQGQYQWLSETLHNMPSDAPQATGVQTQCRGRRCMVSANFSNDDDAREWATSYVLAGSGKLLSRSKILILPATNSNSLRQMQLYFY